MGVTGPKELLLKLCRWCYWIGGWVNNINIILIISIFWRQVIRNVMSIIIRSSESLSTFDGTITLFRITMRGLSWVFWMEIS
jgi:hypothetical protein